MTVTAYVGREIAHLLWDRNISNKDLAAALGIDPTTLSHKLRGRRPWTLEEVLTTAQFFDVPLAELLPESGEATDNSLGSSFGHVAA